MLTNALTVRSGCLAMMWMASVAGGYGQTLSSPALQEPYEAIDGKGRGKWVGTRVVSSATGSSIISAAWGTAFNSPEEYRPTWSGFGKRYGVSVAGNALSDSMEASIGSLWHEDPRYFRRGGPVKGNLKSRTSSIIKQTFLAKDGQGHTMPAYSRYMAITGGNFIQNSWRPDSQADASDAMVRTMYGFLGRMAGNAFQEFWPDMKQRFRRDKN
jgi:hypothetical protein